jgi:glutamate-1-semialdehyde 2,1-aminomutase
LISDLQLISQYRVPFQFRAYLQEHVALGSFWRASEGVHLTDLDDKQFIDVTGSYGVNPSVKTSINLASTMQSRW